MKSGIFRRPSAVKKVFSALGAAAIVCLFFGCSVRESASEVPAAAPTAKPFETARPFETAPPVTGSPQAARPSAAPTASPAKNPAQPDKLVSEKRDLLVLMMAYPGYITGIEKSSGGSIYAVMKSGKKILYDDKKKKTFDEKMADADLQDSLSIIYRLGGNGTLPEGNHDPGRIRPYALIKDVYGDTENEVLNNLAKADIGAQKADFNKRNGALKALEAVFKELNALCSNDPDVKYSVYPLSGTFNYRYISGTELLSMHSFGIAVDLHAAVNPSFRTATREEGQKRIDSFPSGIVRVFEDHGFIWGGKWAHFDIMHFEYRPEIILKAKYQMRPKKEQPWYYGFPDTEDVKKYIRAIDGALG